VAAWDVALNAKNAIKNKRDRVFRNGITAQTKMLRTFDKSILSGSFIGVLAKVESP
jgi:hypothetical protein